MVWWLCGVSHVADQLFFVTFCFVDRLARAKSIPNVYSIRVEAKRLKNMRFYKHKTDKTVTHTVAPLHNSFGYAFSILYSHYFNAIIAPLTS